MEIKVIRSENRKRTISARLINHIMYVYAPASIPEDQLNKIIEKFKRKFEIRKIKQELNKQVDLTTIAQKLNEKYLEGKAQFNSIEYSTNQQRQFGVCNSKNKTIRISHRLASMPDWVRDYVIIHELSHILQPNHSNAFWELVNRYPLAERARGYLIAKSLESNQDIEETT